MGKGRFRQPGAEESGFLSFWRERNTMLHAGCSHRYKRGAFVLKHMKSYAHLKPGQNGTKKLLSQYGKALLCVRYRYDERRGVRLKTVELVVEERPGVPMFLLQDDDMVPIEVRFEETELRERLRGIRARWDPERKLWMAPFRLVRGTDLEARIPQDFINEFRR